MNSVHFNRGATVLNSTASGLADEITTLKVTAIASEFWVAQRIVISHDASGATDFDNLNSKVAIALKFGSDTALWTVDLHPGNGGTSSLEFEAGPWDFDLSPGYMEADNEKNKSLVITAAAFGTGIISTINLLYQ